MVLTGNHKLEGFGPGRWEGRDASALRKMLKKNLTFEGFHGLLWMELSSIMKEFFLLSALLALFLFLSPKARVEIYRLLEVFWRHCQSSVLLNRISHSCASTCLDSVCFPSLLHFFRLLVPSESAPLHVHHTTLHFFHLEHCCPPLWNLRNHPYLITEARLHYS